MGDGTGPTTTRFGITTDSVFLFTYETDITFICVVVIKVLDEVTIKVKVSSLNSMTVKEKWVTVKTYVKVIDFDLILLVFI